MDLKNNRTIAIVIISSFFIPSLRLFAASTSSTPAIVVVPVEDGELDAQSSEMAAEISSTLGFTTSHRVVDTKLAAQVLEYYSGSNEDIFGRIDLKEAEAALSKAKEGYFKFDYDTAERELARAISILEANRSDLTATGPMLVDAYISRAVMNKSRGNTQEARQAIAAALAVNPLLDLNPQDHPPSIVSMLDEEKQKFTDGPVGSISVATNPAAAEVYLNGIRHGVTPVTLKDLPSGNYALKISGNRYQTIERKIELTDEKHIEIKEKLRWRPETSPKKELEMTDAEACVREGLRIAEIMKTDKAVLIDVDPDGKERQIVTARMVDSRFGVGQPPLMFKLEREDEDTAILAELVKRLGEQTRTDIAENPNRRIEPMGMGKPILLEHRKKEFVGTPLFWGLVSGLAAGALGGGLAAAFSGNEQPGGPGSVRVSFGR